MIENNRRLHDLRQPLNVIRLAAGNMSIRIQREADLPSREYYASKLDLIEAQVEMLAALLDEIAGSDANDR
ncbi:MULTISPECIES: hypothetical protein [unclassified Erythrobacter]|uniref:hypothetical protein n=1 Tax=unclassified Erythrobacter TaxID=2633097 RepID=UPI0030C72E79